MVSNVKVDGKWKITENQAYMHILSEKETAHNNAKKRKRTLKLLDNSKIVE